MQLWQFTSIAAIGIGLAMAVALVYVVLRFSAWTPGGGSPVASARMHGMVTALIALFATGTAGLNRLAELGGNDTLSTWDANDQAGAPASRVDVLPSQALEVSDVIWLVAGPAFWLVLIYCVAQYTWPRPAGQVRTARLAAREPGHYLPRVLTWVVGGVCGAALAAVLLAWTTPFSPAVHITDATTGPYGGSVQEWTHGGFRSGGEFAPWMLLGLILLVAATCVVILVIARRPPLAGLSTADDDATRRIATNRVLRTAAVVAVGFLITSSQAWARGVREAALRQLHPDPNDWSPGMFGGFSDPGLGNVPEPARWLDTAAPAVAFVLIVVMLAWRSPALAELGSTWTGGGTAPEGSAEAARRLRRDGRWLAVILGLATGAFALGQVGFAFWNTEPSPWPVLIWTAVPFLVALVPLALVEVAIRRGHSHRLSEQHPVTAGQAPRWRWVVLAVAVVIIAALVFFCLASAWFDTGAALLVVAGLLVAATVGAAFLALRRPTLGRASAAEDRCARAEGADRILGVGAAALFALAASAIHLTQQIWLALFAAGEVVYSTGTRAEQIQGGITIVTSALILAAALSLFWPGPEPRHAEADQEQRSDAGDTTSTGAQGLHGTTPR